VAGIALEPCQGVTRARLTEFGPDQSVNDGTESGHSMMVSSYRRRASHLIRWLRNVQVLAEPLAARLQRKAGPRANEHQVGLRSGVHQRCESSMPERRSSKEFICAQQDRVREVAEPRG
jgi:hypothetical protein